MGDIEMPAYAMGDTESLGLLDGNVKAAGPAEDIAIAGAGFATGVVANIVTGIVAVGASLLIGFVLLRNGGLAQDAKELLEALGEQVTSNSLTMAPFSYDPALGVVTLSEVDLQFVNTNSTGVPGHGCIVFGENADALEDGAQHCFVMGEGHKMRAAYTLAHGDSNIMAADNSAAISSKNVKFMPPMMGNPGGVFGAAIAHDGAPGALSGYVAGPFGLMAAGRAGVIGPECLNGGLFGGEDNMCKADAIGVPIRGAAVFGGAEHVIKYDVASQHGGIGDTLADVAVVGPGAAQLGNVGMGRSPN